MDMIFTILLLVAFLFSFSMLTLYCVHMFQLNSYKPSVQLKWLRDNILPAVVGRNLGVLVAAIPLMFWGIFGKIAAILLFVLSGYCNRPRPAKKALVYTARIKRMLLTIVLLVALANTGAVILYYYNLGWIAGLLLTICHLATPLVALLANLINQPIEQSINRWYINDAKKLLGAMPNMKVVGITGSYGKTSVKFFLNRLLSAKYNVLMTPESFNTPLGIVKTIRQSLRATHEIFICEMGAKNIGDIKEICDIVHPDCGIVTSIGPQHLESFLTVENVIRTKFELMDALPKDGKIFINQDSTYIQETPLTRPAVRYGMAEESDYRAYNLKVSRAGSTFTVACAEGEFSFTTKLIGAHNVANIVGAIACAHTLGVSMEDLMLQVGRLESVPHRLQLIQGHQALIIDDAYNSNPSGAKAALDTLACFEGAKILVTPGMIELGSMQESANRTFGTQAATICDYVVLVGEKQTKPIYNGLLDANYPAEKIFVEHDLKQALKAVENLKTGSLQKIVLLENDLPDNF